MDGPRTHGRRLNSSILRGGPDGVRQAGLDRLWCGKKALKFGEFTLASGKKATYYLDGKQVTLDSSAPS